MYPAILIEKFHDVEEKNLQDGEIIFVDKPQLARVQKDKWQRRRKLK
jgi:hypothetical protein